MDVSRPSAGQRYRRAVPNAPNVSARILCSGGLAEVYLIYYGCAIAHAAPRHPAGSAHHAGLDEQFEGPDRRRYPGMYHLW